MSARENPEQRAARLTAELRAATSEAAGVLKDLVRALNQARTMVDEYAVREVHAPLDEHTELWQGMITQWHEAARADVEQALRHMRDTMQQNVDMMLDDHLVLTLIVYEVLEQLTERGIVLDRPKQALHMIRAGGDSPPDLIVDAR